MSAVSFPSPFICSVLTGSVSSRLHLSKIQSLIGPPPAKMTIRRSFKKPDVLNRTLCWFSNRRCKSPCRALSPHLSQLILSRFSPTAGACLSFCLYSSALAAPRAPPTSVSASEDRAQPTSSSSRKGSAGVHNPWMATARPCCRTGGPVLRGK